MVSKNINLLKIFLGLTFILLPSICMAHFGTIMLKNTMLDQYTRKTQAIFAFIHPFEQNGMDLEIPDKVEMINLTTGEKIDLINFLIPKKILNHKAYKSNIAIKKPGVYCIYMIPKPYFEPAEDKFIKHITKTYLAAFGEEEGWSKPLGLEVEIVPLTRPFGLYAGNVFRGKVLRNGQPIAGAEVEVEYFNRGSKIKARNEYMVTQVVLTDDKGVFSYSPPAPGWWGFSALTEADYKIQHNGQDKPVEVGGVIWVKFLPWGK